MNREAYLFNEWSEIVKYLSSSKMYQDVQHLKNKIENLDYNIKFIGMLKSECQKNEKLLNSNKS